MKLILILAAALLTCGNARPKKVPTHLRHLRKPMHYPCPGRTPAGYSHECVAARGCWSMCRNATHVDLTGPPRVVAIVATCNRTNSLADAVDSVLAQTVAAFEILISIDNGAKCVASIENVWGGKVKVGYFLARS